MTLETPIWLQAGSYSALSDRTILDALFGTGGVIGAADLIVTQRAAGANMSVDVAAGSVIIAGTDVSEQGKYLNRSSAVTNVAIATAPGSGNSRIDVIYARDQDAAAIGGSTNNWIISVVAGTASGSPSPPSIPASSIALANVLVGTSVTSIVNANITNKRIQSTAISRNPNGRLTLGSTQSAIGQNVWTQIVGLSASFSSGVTATSNQFTIMTPGKYRICADLSAPTMVTVGDGAFIGIYINGSINKSIQATAGAGLLATPQISTLLNLSAGDTVQLWFNQPTTGGFGTEVTTAELSIEMVAS